MVRPRSSPFYSPVLLVHKNDGTYRMCVDYCALNQITIKNQFLVPRVEDFFDKLQGSTYFTRIDLKSGYHQIIMREEDVCKMEFRIWYNHYEYLAMPLGLTNALTMFIMLMNDILWLFMGKFVVDFIDDMLVYSKNISKHETHLTFVFQALHDTRLYANQEKTLLCLAKI